jgi:hypothetical protein
MLHNRAKGTKRHSAAEVCVQTIPMTSKVTAISALPKGLLK